VSEEIESDENIEDYGEEFPVRPTPELIIFEILIDGDPVSKQRPRFAPNRGGRYYTPKKSVEAEGYIADQIVEVYKDAPDDKTIFGMWLRFFSKTYQRRDVDNMVKLVFDACNGVVWKDDAQVVELIATVRRAAVFPRTEIVCYRKLGSQLYHTINCDYCGKERRAYPSLTKMEHNFCDKKCMGLWRTQQTEKRNEELLKAMGLRPKIDST